MDALCCLCDIKTNLIADCENYEPSGVDCSSTTKPAATLPITTPSTTSLNSSTPELIKTSRSTSTNFITSISERTESSYFSTSTINTSLSGTQQNRTAFSLPVEGWIGISLGIFVVLIIVVVITLFFLKKSRFYNNLNKNKQAGSGYESNIHSSGDEDGDSKTNSTKLSFENTYVNHYPIASSKMTVDALHHDFDSLTSGKNVRNESNKEKSNTEIESSEMKMNILYDGCPCPSEQQEVSSQSDPQTDTCMYAKVNKYNSILPTTSQNSNFYYFTESISDSLASGEKTSDYLYDKLN